MQEVTWIDKWRGIREQEWFKEMFRMKVKITYEVFLFMLALIALATLFSDNEDYIWIDRFIWLVFFLDVVVRFVRAPKKWQFIKENPLDIIVAIPLDAIFQSAKILRIFRLIRIILIATRFMNPIYQIIRENKLERTISFALVLIFIVSIPVNLVEPDIQNYGDAVWWSIVTMTTVGYGDISPSTGLGRTLAVILMIVGIGIIGVVTGSIASYLIGHKQDSEDDDVKYIESKLKNPKEWTEQDTLIMKTMIDILYEKNQDKDSIVKIEGTQKRTG
ncbi:hypothetical protein JMA_43360 (plasmid) [Jeotgalibacillus malaysiensis]|uniref:Potassium channel domain-containing protein n=1 Tax=Jeotgalibacillus malaysiensis TaxID=1508404 RepID=A0A0B5AYQ6_9BACL|nr:potassium channel family protein [Jeotgalibacillus malaysiensis]AJD93653.1 hypothetical protein JMA_43360 [Jeotgalibacillus malaysiensis]